MAVGIVGFLLLQARAVRKQDAAQVACRGGAMNATAKTIAHQQRQVTAMVDVGVCEDYGVYVGRVYRQRRPVAQAQLFVALEQAAVDKDFTATVL